MLEDCRRVDGLDGEWRIRHCAALADHGRSKLVITRIITS